MSKHQNNSDEQDIGRYFFRASASDFLKIPSQPIAYWSTRAARESFEKNEALECFSPARAGLQTGENDKFVRFWHEVDILKFAPIGLSQPEYKESPYKWYPYNSGGTYRKWYGNNEKVVDWERDGINIKKDKLEKLKIGLCLPSNSKPKNEQFYFLPSVTWTKISSSSFGVRICEKGFIFDIAGSSAFPPADQIHSVAAFLNSKLASVYLNYLNPTMNIQSGDIGKFPWARIPISKRSNDINAITLKLKQISRTDWDSSDTSWDFTNLSLLHAKHQQPTLKASYQSLRTYWREITLEMQRLEEENNRIFIEAYGLQDELTPEVPLKEITLTCNPHYRYGGDKTEEELEALLLADTMREFISYAVGCMFGRYSLDKPGLILANQGETLADYLAQVPEPTFMPDKDNVIPMLDGDWFADDIAERFRRFLRVTFGEEHYEENLRFIEESLNVKGKRSYSLRDYFLNEFYTDHLKRYKKRPIYWLFSSPKGSFNALIYMHRYRPDTVSVVLNNYLREFRAKLLARKNHLEALGISASASQAEKTKALKEIEKLSKMIAEVDAYERDTLYPLATQQLEIDLDDGVKANYPKFGAALKKIPGLEAKDD